MFEDDSEVDVTLDIPVVDKPSRAERLIRSEAARLRRKEAREAKEVHSYKDEKDANERLRAKRRLEKQKKKSA